MNFIKRLKIQFSPTNIAILVSALGYFVDVFDLLLFSIVRVKSLEEIGLSGEAVTSYGVYILNLQMIGLMVGGLVWGVLGDKIGRIQVLFGSIIIYSLASIANAFVQDPDTYAVLRFIAGFGLAGELGAGITLVSELMKPKNRGYGATLVASVGVAGAIAASLIGEFVEWRTAYFIGGVLGLCLLLLRISVSESDIFNKVKEDNSNKRGDIRLFFVNKERFLRYLFCIMSGIPIWFFVGVIVTFSPEIGSALNLSESIKAPISIFYCYIGLTLGDLASGVLSQYLRSRKKVFLLFISLLFLSTAGILSLNGASSSTFYILLLIAGFFVGYWAVFMTNIAEQFGTNLRATATTTAPNFVRGSTVIATTMFQYLKPYYGTIDTIHIISCIFSLIAILSVLKLKETYGIELEYIEK